MLGGATRAVTILGPAPAARRRAMVVPAQPPFVASWMPLLGAYPSKLLFRIEANKLRKAEMKKRQLHGGSQMSRVDIAL